MIPSPPPTNTQSTAQIPVDDGVRFLYDQTGYKPCPGQEDALGALYAGKDAIPVAKTGYKKTLVITGYHAFLPAATRAVTLMIPPLKGNEAESYAHFSGSISQCGMVDLKSTFQSLPNPSDARKLPGRHASTYETAQEYA